MSQIQQKIQGQIKTNIEKLSELISKNPRQLYQKIQHLKGSRSDLQTLNLSFLEFPDESKFSHFLQSNRCSIDDLQKLSKINNDLSTFILFLEHKIIQQHQIKTEYQRNKNQIKENIEKLYLLIISLPRQLYHKIQQFKSSQQDFKRLDLRIFFRDEIIELKDFYLILDNLLENFLRFNRCENNDVEYIKSLNTQLDQFICMLRIKLEDIQPIEQMYNQIKRIKDNIKKLSELISKNPRQLYQKIQHLKGSRSDLQTLNLSFLEFPDESKFSHFLQSNRCSFINLAFFNSKFDRFFESLELTGILKRKKIQDPRIKNFITSIIEESDEIKKDKEYSQIVYNLKIGSIYSISNFTDQDLPTLKKRILMDFMSYKTDPHYDGNYSMENEIECFKYFFVWHGIIMGPLDSIYESYSFPFRILIPRYIINQDNTIILPGYPNVPPIIYFDPSKILHMNINRENGFMCLSILKSHEWTATINVVGIINVVISVLKEPVIDGPQNEELKNLYLTNKTEHNKIIRKFLARAHK